MIKRKMRLLTGLLAVMLCCAALTPAAFAYADDPETTETADPGDCEACDRGRGAPHPGGQPDPCGRH